MAEAKARRPAVGFILVSVWLDVLSLGVIIPVFAPLLQNFEGGDAAAAGRLIGVFAMAWAVAQFFCAPILGGLSDRFGRRPVLLISLAGLGLDYILMAFAPTIGWLFVGRVIAGMTAAGMAVASAYIADVTPPEERAKTFGWIGAAWGLGFIVGPVLGGGMAELARELVPGLDERAALRAPFIAAAAMTLVAAVYGGFVLPESLAEKNRAPFAWKKANPFGALEFLRSQRDLLGLSGVNVLVQVAHNVLPVIFVLYASNRYGWTVFETSAALAFTGACNIVIQGLLVKPVVARIGEAGAMIAGILFGGLGFAIYGIAPTGWTFLVGTPVFGLIGLFGPGFQGLITRRVGPDEQGRLQGANASLMGLTAIVGPPLFAFTYAWFVASGHPYVPGAPFLLAALLHGLAVLLALAIVGRFAQAKEPA